MFKDSLLPGCIHVSPKCFPDFRGYFGEIWKHSSYGKHQVGDFKQINRSFSLRKGTLRGLHYQLNPYAQGKLVMVITGSIFDVAVDLRVGSPTYGRWVGAELSESNLGQLWIPPGFAHGFVTLQDNVHVIYCCTGSEYQPTAERSIVWNDPEIDIGWPIEPTSIIDKDANAPLLADAENNFAYDPAG